MAFDLFKLAGSVFINTEDANKSLSKTDTKAQNFGKTLGKVAGVGLSVGTAVVGMGVAATGALVDMSKNASDTTDEIDKMSQRLGLSTTAYQELDYVLGQAGVDINSFQTGMKSLLKNMDGAKDGTKAAFENFEKLGVSVVDSNGKLRSQEEVLFEVITAFQAMKDGAEKSRLAQELFGKQGQEIIPLLNSESGSFEKLVQKANDLGLVLEEDVIKNGVKLHDDLDSLEKSFGMLKTTLGGALMPIISQLVEFLVERMPMVQEIIAKLSPVAQVFFDTLIPVLEEMVDQLMPVFEEIMLTLQPLFSELIGAIMPVLVELLQKVLPVLVEIIQKIAPVAVELLIQLIPLIDALLPILDPIIEQSLVLLDLLVPIITHILPPLITMVAKLITTAMPLITMILDQALSLVPFLVSLITNNVLPIIDNILLALGGLVDFVSNVLTGNFEEAGYSLLQFFEGILGALGDIVYGAINIVIDAINYAIKSVANALDKIPDDVPILGSFKFSPPQIPRIPMLEEGGTLMSGGSVLVGEKAPEILDLPAGARVRPLDNLGTMSKEDMRDAMIEALQSVGISLELSADSDAMFKDIISQNTIYKNRHNGASALA